jgi:hypothetical protein
VDRGEGNHIGKETEGRNQSRGRSERETHGRLQPALLLAGGRRLVAGDGKWRRSGGRLVGRRLRACVRVRACCGQEGHGNWDRRAGVLCGLCRVQKMYRCVSGPRIELLAIYFFSSQAQDLNASSRSPPRPRRRSRFHCTRRLQRRRGGLLAFRLPPCAGPTAVVGIFFKKGIKKIKIPKRGASSKKFGKWVLPAR